MTYIPPLSIAHLDGTTIVSWIGLEEPLIGEGTDLEPLEWRHPDVQFSYFGLVDVTLDSGLIYRVNSYFDREDGSPFGLMLNRIDQAAVPAPWIEGEYCRTVVLASLPAGKCAVSVVKREGDAVIEAHVAVGAHVVRLLSGEIYPRANDEFEIVEADEMVLLQLDGRTLPPQ
jgi:hypothetical protein